MTWLLIPAGRALSGSTSPNALVSAEPLSRRRFAL